MNLIIAHPVADSMTPCDSSYITLGTCIHEASVFSVSQHHAYIVCDALVENHVALWGGGLRKSLCILVSQTHRHSLYLADSCLELCRLDLPIYAKIN